MAISEEQVKRAQQITAEVAKLQRELFELGLPATSARMAQVNQRLGWELSEKMAMAGLVGKDEKRRVAWRQSKEKPDQGEPWPG